MKFIKKIEDRIYNNIMYSVEQRLDGCARLFLFTKEQEEYSRLYKHGIPISMLRPVDANTAIQMVLDHFGLKLKINEDKHKDIVVVTKDEK